MNKSTWQSQVLAARIPQIRLSPFSSLRLTIGVNFFSLEEFLKLRQVAEGFEVVFARSRLEAAMSRHFSYFFGEKAVAVM